MTKSESNPHPGRQMHKMYFRSRNISVDKQHKEVIMQTYEFYGGISDK